MARIIKKKVEKVKQKYEDRSDIKPLSFYIAIVPRGEGNSITKLFNSLGSILTFSQIGLGTASKDVYDILGIENNKKDIVFTLCRKEDLPLYKVELEAYFKMDDSSKGIGFSVDLKAISSVTAYRIFSKM
ncbi:MAG: hypothetical protein ACI31G_04945 [Bacilli bacterium]